MGSRLAASYAQCLAHEPSLKGIEFTIQHPLPVRYKGIKLDCGYRVDLLIEDRMIIELKSVDRIKGIHEAQLLTYMRLAGIKTGLQMNFNITKQKSGIKRFVL